MSEHESTSEQQSMSGQRFRFAHRAGSDLRLEDVSCPLCGSNDSRRVLTGYDNLTGIAGKFHVDACRQCRHRFMNPRPVPEDLPDCYPDGYGPHQSAPPIEVRSANDGENDAGVVAASDGRPWYLRYLPLKRIPGLRSLFYWLLDDRGQIFPAAQPRASGASPRALEVGCATGQYLQRLKQSGWDVQGVEPGKAAAGIARDTGLSVHVGTLDSFDVERESFELVAAWMVLEHVPDPRATLRQMRAALVPGGTLLLSVPNAGSLEARFFGSSWYALELPRHLQHYAPSSIRRLLSESGFGQIKVMHQRNLLNIPGSLGIGILRKRPDSRFGRWLLNGPDSPRQWMQLLFAPFAHLMSIVGQGGRMTIVAVKSTTDGKQL